MWVLLVGLLLLGTWPYVCLRFSHSKRSKIEQMRGFLWFIKCDMGGPSVTPSEKVNSAGQLEQIRNAVDISHESFLGPCCISNLVTPFCWENQGKTHILKCPLGHGRWIFKLSNDYPLQRHWQPQTRNPGWLLHGAVPQEIISILGNASA